MKCTISGQNAIVLAKSIQSFARIGTELFIEAESKGLSIRTVNKTSSAFAMMVFERNFFSAYDITTATTDEYKNKCKISMKSCLGAFRNMKQVEECQLCLDPVNNKLKIQLKCRLETIKTHYITILENESLQVVYTKDNVPNTLTGSNKLFDDIVSNFMSNEEELVFEAAASEIVVKNYIEGSVVDIRYMRSQLKLKPDEFDRYSIKTDTSIAFSLRELKAFLNFADALGLDVTMNFETTGSPVVFALGNCELEANLVMSTLAREDHEPSIMVTNNNSKQTRKTKRTHDETVSSISNISNVNQSLATPTDPELFNFSRKVRPTINVNTSQPSIVLPAPSSSVLPTPPSFVLPAPPSFVLPLLPPANILQPTPAANTNTMMDESLPSTKDTTEPGPRLQPPESEDIIVQFCEESDEPNVIPASPTSQKKRRIDLRHIFSRCFQTQPYRKSQPNASQILAENSDPEDGI